MNIWVILPTYNERGNVSAIVGRLFALLPEIHVLIVDDNSPDGTAQEVASLQTRFPNLRLLLRTEDRGFGKAYLAGFSRVLELESVDAILMMDADLSHDPEHIPAMIARLATCDAVIGSRYIRGGGVDGWEYWRRVLSKAGNFYIRAVTRMPFHDCISGFLLIRTELLRRLDLSAIGCSGYAFLMELKYTMWRAKAVICEAPIIFRNRAEGESKLAGHIVAEGIRAPWNVLSKARQSR